MERGAVEFRGIGQAKFGEICEMAGVFEGFLEKFHLGFQMDLPGEGG